MRCIAIDFKGKKYVIEIRKENDVAIFSTWESVVPRPGHKAPPSRRIENRYIATNLRRGKEVLTKAAEEGFALPSCLFC